MKKYLIITLAIFGAVLAPHLSHAATWTLTFNSNGSTCGISNEYCTNVSKFPTSTSSGNIPLWFQCDNPVNQVTGASVSTSTFAGGKYNPDAYGWNNLSWYGGDWYEIIRPNGGWYDGTSGPSYQPDAWGLSFADAGTSYNIDCGGVQSAGTITLQDATPTFNYPPVLTFLFPTEGTTTPQFNNFVVQASHVTSTDIYELEGSWYLPITQQTTNFPVQKFTGAQLENGVTIPFSGLPNLCPNSNCALNGVPANADAEIFDTATWFPPLAPDATTSIAFNIGTQSDLYSPSSTYYYVSVASGTIAIATSSVPTNPLYSAGNFGCPAPSGTILTDIPGNVANILCQLENIFIYPHQTSINAASNAFSLVQNDVPYSYVYAALDGFESSSVALETATSSDLSLALLPSAGQSGIIPTSSLSIISNTAYASLVGSTGASSTLTTLWDTEDYVFYFLLLALVVGVVTAARKGYH